MTCRESNEAQLHSFTTLQSPFPPGVRLKDILMEQKDVLVAGQITILKPFERKKKEHLAFIECVEIFQLEGFANHVSSPRPIFGVVALPLLLY